MATATLFSDILHQGFSKRFKNGEMEVIDWYRDKALSVTSKNMSGERLINRAGSKVNTVAKPMPGKALMFSYDPKHKLTLPYYDTFPVIFPLELYKDGFLGINLHYLPPVYRARLMDMLYDTLNNNRYDSTTKLKINYKILNAASRYKYFKPCIKQYLFSHIRSPMVEISPTEWDYVMFLPLSRFQKASQRKVWDDSIKMIMSGK
jgi:hypothetical protein